MFTKGQTVKILPGSWVHKINWLAIDQIGTGEVVKVHKNGKVDVRVNEIRNKLKRDCATTLGRPRVLSFASSELGESESN